MQYSFLIILILKIMSFLQDFMRLIIGHIRSVVKTIFVYFLEDIGHPRVSTIVDTLGCPISSF